MRTGFNVEGMLVSDAGVQHEVRVACTRTPLEKRFLINGTPPERLAAVIGRFPVVVLSPEKGSITFGGPAERRKFMDLALSQVSASYLGDILEYRKALRQRNRILSDHRVRGTFRRESSSPGRRALLRTGAGLHSAARCSPREIRSHIVDAYRTIMPEMELPEIGYVCGFSAGEAGDVRAYAAGLASELESMKCRGTAAGA